MNKHFLKLVLIAVAFLIATPACCAAKWKAQHVIIIGFDGWGSYSMEKGAMPHVKQLMRDGAYTLEKRSVLPSSSAVNWASMFMGAGPELHGFTEWGSQKPELPSRVIYKNNIFPSVFQLLRDSKSTAEIGVLYEWPGIKFVIDTLSLSYHAKSLSYDKSPTDLCDLSVNYIKEKRPNLLAICFNSPDDVGHQVGHDTPAYYERLEILDGYVARIVEAVKDAGMLDNTVFIITSDHGGIKKGHGGKTMREMETPFIISGKGVKKGYKLEDSMMQFDVASTIAHIFRLKQPQVWIGRPMTKVFK